MPIVDRIRPLLTQSSNALFSTGSVEGRINVTIRRWDESGASSDTPFVMKSSSPFKAIFRIYSIRESKFPNCYGYFKFMAGDRVLCEDDCPMDVCISDGDCIDAVPAMDDLVGSRFV